MSFWPNPGVKAVVPTTSLAHLHLAGLAPESVNGGARDGPLRNAQRVLGEEIDLPPLCAPGIAPSSLVSPP